MADPRRNADPAITVKTEVRDGAAFVTPVGDVDLTASPVLRQELKKVQTTRPQRLIVDLAQVPYMDSSGVATLVEAMKTAQQNRTRLVLCGLQPKVKSIFEIARLDTVFAITTDAQKALTH